MVESDAERFERVRDEFEKARASMAEARYTATSEDGYVTAVVNAQGHVLDFEFDPRVRRLDTHDLREALLSAITEARTEAVSSRDQALQEVFGPAYRQSTLESGSVTEIQSMVDAVGNHVHQQHHDQHGEGS